MNIVDTKQLDFLITLDKRIYQCKQSLCSDSDSTYYIPMDFVNADLAANGMAMVDDIQELIDNQYVNVEEDEYRKEIVVTITAKGQKYLDIYGLG